MRIFPAAEFLGNRVGRIGFGWAGHLFVASFALSGWLSFTGSAGWPNGTVGA